MKIDSQKYISNLLRLRVGVLKEAIRQDKFWHEKDSRSKLSVVPPSIIATKREIKEAEEALRELGEMCSKYGNIDDRKY